MKTEFLYSSQLLSGYTVENKLTRLSLTILFRSTFFWFNFIVDKFILHREKCRYDGRGIGRVRWG